MRHFEIYGAAILLEMSGFLFASCRNEVYMQLSVFEKNVRFYFQGIGSDVEKIIHICCGYPVYLVSDKFFRSRIEVHSSQAFPFPVSPNLCNFAIYKNYLPQDQTDYPKTDPQAYHLLAELLDQSIFDTGT